MTSTPVLVSSNFTSLFSLKKNKILNSIISYENAGKMCTFGECSKLASIIIYFREEGVKTVLCMKHAKLSMAVNEIFDEKNDRLFVVKLYHPYLMSVTYEMDYLLGSVYRLESSIYQHAVSMSEEETEEMKRMEKVKKNNLDSEWEPVFRLDIERNSGYAVSGKKMHCINGVRRYVTDCSHSELNNNAYTFGSVATVICTKCVVHSLKNTDYYIL